MNSEQLDYSNYNAVKIAVHILLLFVYIYFTNFYKDVSIYFNNGLIVYQVILIFTIINDLCTIKIFKRIKKDVLNEEKEIIKNAIRSRVIIALSEVEQYSWAVLWRHTLIIGLAVMAGIKHGDFILCFLWLFHEILIFSIYDYSYKYKELDV